MRIEVNYAKNLKLIKNWLRPLFCQADDIPLWCGLKSEETQMTTSSHIAIEMSLVSMMSSFQQHYIDATVSVVYDLLKCIHWWLYNWCALCFVSVEILHTVLFLLLGTGTQLWSCPCCFKVAQLCNCMLCYFFCTQKMQ